jgi:repressor of nif and glnA expression
VSTFVDRGVSRGQRGGSPTVVNLSFLDRRDSNTTWKIMRSVILSHEIHIGDLLLIIDQQSPMQHLSTRERDLRSGHHLPFRL